MFTLEFVIDGEVQVLTALSRFEEYADDMTPAYEEIRDDFKAEYVPNVFASQGAYNGDNWVPLNPLYAAQKERRFPGNGILVATGAMADSLMGGAGFVSDIGPQTLIVGTSTPYALFHQRGTSRMPMRKIIDIPQDVRLRWAKICQRFLVRMARGLGFETTGDDV